MVNVAITGAGRGIGLELVKQYAVAGDRVFALCRNPAGAGELRSIADGSNGKATVHKFDVADDASVKTGAADTGSDRIDVLLNVAGIVGGGDKGLDDQTWSEWHDALEVMVIGPVRVMQAFLPCMKEGSKVITITSQLAASTWPYGGFYAYAAAKAGVNRVMRSAAIDLKDRGIVVGVVHPGWVQTDMGGPEAEITPQESAAGIRKVVADWTLDRSGDFLKWNGETHPW
ncbi:SDR family oxidoreductase [Sphingomonas sp.]|uniref:SDR family oxidoreductase n=1 Tax=Sphingomonas sp. TaxID=28214 RepID=UPI0037534104